ncbi:biotin/lipoate A/B protein ligase family protein [Mechercharimyces sp. CAU 1602]|uniref:lipoate--protein ligase family protein n=1 Tax=Mechercharimyces sp. CAU 1602 TaxID=2973933 RepID=UPI0021610C60|nr:biotin/lipoate A/B protein ligase family protein [Mechercharimyces sp. CAU 1602]MCS1350731.1 lipoate--protein ligase family protein [Mechercharimyces sp. CAU 1602]
MKMKSEWRFIVSGPQSGAENMAVDEAILTASSEGMAPPTIRFYEWDPAAVSIGYFQRVQEELDIEKIYKNKLGLVRRATGGRAILHQRELTYSVILSEQYPGMPTSVTDSYRVISRGLMEGFRNLGLSAEMTAPLAGKLRTETAACFDTPSSYELVVEGRKVAGSAQTRQRGIILQHGSIPLDLDVEMLFEVLRFASVEEKQKMKEAFLSKAVAIEQLSKRTVTMDEMILAFQKGFAKGLDITLVPGALTAYEQELAKQLSYSRYNTDEWNLRR